MTSLSNRHDQLYFAYGSNLNAEDLDAWCREHDHPASFLDPVEPAYLLDHHLDFSHYSKRRGGGALNIRPRAAAVVPGLLFRVRDPAGWKCLDAKEGAGTRYQVTEATACNLNGDLIPAITYRVPNHEPVHHPPTDHYANVVRKGLMHHRLPTDFLDATIRNDCGGHSIDNLFLYGTLMKGQCRQHHLPARHVRNRSNTHLPGQLYDTGDGYPALKWTGPDSPHRVSGERLECHQIETLIQKLDRIEGFEGYHSPANLYHRRLVRLSGGGAVHCPAHHRNDLAWTYTYAAGLDSMTVIDGGCWRSHPSSSSNPSRTL